MGSLAKVGIPAVEPEFPLSSPLPPRRDLTRPQLPPLRGGETLPDGPDVVPKNLLPKPVLPPVEKHAFVRGPELSREKALEVVRTVNALHAENDGIRFKSAEPYDASQLFQIIGHGRSEIYTSSYHWFVDRLLSKLKEPGQAEGFFQYITSPENKALLTPFLEAAAAYHRTNDILAIAPKGDVVDKIAATSFDALEKSIQDFIGNRVPNLVYAAAIADTMTALSGRPELRETLDRYEKELIKRYDESDPNSNLHKVLGLIGSAYSQLPDAPLNNDLFKTRKFSEAFPIEMQSTLPESVLFTNGVHRQHVLFHEDPVKGDGDGLRSYANFLKTYKQEDGWQLQDKDSFVVLSKSLNGRTVEIVANKPDRPDGVRASRDYLDGLGVDANSIVHRGHSFFTDRTLPYIERNMAFVSWGSCGSYQLSHQSEEKAPGIHVIGNTGTGSMYVNDPLMKSTMEAMLQTGKIDWKDVWSRTAENLKGKPSALSHFAHYIRPDQNYGAMMDHAYRQLSYIPATPLRRRADLQGDHHYGLSTGVVDGLNGLTREASTLAPAQLAAVSLSGVAPVL